MDKRLADELRGEVLRCGSGPLFTEMPRLTLEDKLQNGPTAAHRIEEIHTPYNFAYITATTGSSAFQNLVGVTHQELARRTAAGVLALQRAGIRQGGHLLITYPPLVGVFSREVFDRMELTVSFIDRPSRDALIADLCAERPDAVIGESSFLRAALVDARRLGLLSELPNDLIFLAAGSPLDPELQEETGRLTGAAVHDLYGCQEFGWLCLDGTPLREDITLWAGERTDGRKHLIVGGLPTGDCFFTRAEPDGTEQILTPTRVRAEMEPEVWVLETTAANRETAVRAARTILRIKGKIVRVEKNCACAADSNVLRVTVPNTSESFVLKENEKTLLFNDLLEAQKMYQREGRGDPVWNKNR